MNLKYYLLVLIVAAIWSVLGGGIANRVRKDLLGDRWWNNIHPNAGLGWKTRVILTLLDGPINWLIFGGLWVFEKILWPFEKVSGWVAKKIVERNR